MTPQHEPVAIVGMGCRWPGGVRTTSQFWSFLRDRTDGWKEFSGAHFSARGFHHPNPDRPGSVAMKGAFLAEEDARLFDHSFFGMTGLEVETMDPSQRKLLEVAYEAIENAGDSWESVSGSRTGVFVGNFCLDHWMIQSRDWDYPRPYAFTGAGTSILANRISYVFNFQGPSLTVDTACSSSMYALHLAVNAIRAGDCDSAIVASANWIADPGVQIALDKLGALSASSRCHTFDARADGYARGEGYGAIYLKRPSVAIADQSPIRAMIRGTAINSNGRTGGITRPSANGQETVIREAYRNAGDLPFGDTGYFECHGTGTYVGDPIEVAAVGRVFAADRSAEDPLLVGSVKSNVGHGEGASALASIMKVVLALENGAIPPVFSLQTRNPNIDFLDGRIEPVTVVTPWPANRLQRASINSFGYGGANGHCIVDHVSNVLPGYVAPGVYNIRANGTSNGLNGHVNGYLNGGESAQHHPSVQSPKVTAAPNATTRQFVLLPISAHNENSLRLNVDALAQVIARLPLADVAYTLGTRRSRFAQRSFCVVDKDELARGLLLERKAVRAPLKTVELGFIFTGQGAQWHGMGRELLEYRVFGRAIRQLDDVLSMLPDPPSWSLAGVISGELDADLIQTAAVSQTICTAVQIGLVDLLASWSVRPSGVVGHSSGEIAAAYASGHISQAEAIVAAYLRGQAVSRNVKAGAMLAVGLGANEVAKYLSGREDEVKVAAINSPGSVTLSGEDTAIDAISRSMTDDGIFNRKLNTGGNAYHSHHMIPIGREYVMKLRERIVHLQKLGLTSAQQRRYQQVRWVSSVTPNKTRKVDDDLASYWAANLESPVRFSEAVNRLVDTQAPPIDGLVEIGPHSALKSPLEQILKAACKDVFYASTLKRGEDGRKSVLQLAGTLFTWNATIDLGAVNAVDAADGTRLEHGCTCVELPPYQYTYSGLNYYESRLSKEYRLRSVLRHDLLGSKVVGNAKLRPQWRNILRIKDVPWLVDHRLVPDAVLPGAAYIAMAAEAAFRIHEDSPKPLAIKGFTLRDVVIKKALVIPGDDYGVEIMTSMDLIDAATAESPTWATFSISSVGRENNDWTEHTTGRVKVELQASGEGRKQESEMTSQTLRAVDARAWYKKFRSIGLDYGPTFRPLSNVRADASSNRAVATVSLDTTTVKGGESRYALHPAALDGAIQLGLIACHGGRPSEARTAFVPVQFPHLYIANHGTLGGECTTIARGERKGIRSAYINLRMVAPSGEVLLDVDNLRCISYSSEIKATTDRAFSSPFTRLVWKPDLRALSNCQARQMYPPPPVNVDKSHLWGITNKVAHFIVLSIYERFGRLEHAPKPSGDVGHFFNWVVRKSENDKSELMEEARKAAGEDILISSIDELVGQAADVVEVKIAKLLHDNMQDILYERRSGMDVILSEDLLTPLYQSGLLMTGIYPQLYHVLDILAHSNPNMRVLEIGGGTGGATRVAMQAFTGPNGIKAYRDYTFTDYSPGFLSSAREAFAGLRDMHFSVFDMENSPLEQGYQEGAYDLIIACQVLHATSNMRKTLSNCRRLLRPGGKLVLVETNQHFTVPGVVVGTFTGYWAGIPDGRVDAPFQDLPAWDSSLQDAGFSGLDIVLDDFPSPHNTTSVILSTALSETEDPFPQPAGVLVLYTSQTAPLLVEQISEELSRRQVAARVLPLHEALDSITSESRVVALLDERYLLVDTGAKELQAFQHVARNSASLVALTSTGTVRGRNPYGALISGLLRVLQNENPGSQYMSIDIEADNFQLGNEEGQDLAHSIVDQLFQLKLDSSSTADEEEAGNPLDREFSWQDGCLWLSRHVPDAGFHSQHGLSSRDIKIDARPLASQGPVRAAFEAPGVLNSIYFTPYKELLQPLPSGFIDVAVAAVGLNWSDMRHLTGELDRNFVSSEYSGIVAAVGPQVDGLRVGDRVYGLGQGQLGNYTRVPAAYSNKVRVKDDLVQMASIPLAYMTAVYAFDHVTHLKRGESVLVHYDTGKDVGLACMLLAKEKGADVYALVETDDQASVLSEELAILPISHVILSGNLADLQRAAKVTHKGGFRAIISTAQGELLSSFMQCLAPRGYLVDVDVQTTTTAALGMIRTNATYCSVDIFSILESEPALGAELVQAVSRYYQEGTIGPIPKIEAVDVAELGAALGNISNRSGKLVVNFQNPESLVRMSPSPQTVFFDPKAYYIVTGAFGGLGKSLVQWMVDRGARNMALLSRRSVGSIPEAKELVESLTKRGIHILSFACDVSDQNQVTDVVRQISSIRPIKGVIHAAVSYLDLTFDKVSASRWNEGLSAKVQGTKNLHEATLSMPLDFFVMTTSALSVYAFPTQGAYTAANNFQDAFARYRRQMGLPASTVSFSLITEMTDVGTDPTTVDLFERNKALTLAESEFLALVEPAFLNSQTAADDAVSGIWSGQQDDPLSAANLHTYLDPAVMMAKKRDELASDTGSSSLLPRWYTDGRVSLIMRAFLDAQRDLPDSLHGSPGRGAKDTITHLRAEFDAALQRGPDARASTVAFVQRTIAQAVAEMLFVDIESIDPAKSVADLGVDSLIAAELRNWFLQALGTNISMLDLLDPGLSIAARAANITDKALALQV